MKMKGFWVGWMVSWLSFTAMAQQPHVVFVMGDDEYRSEESMPMLAKILARELNAKVSLCFPMDPDGRINPNIKNNISGLEALETADLMVLYLRWRQLPPQQLQYITDYLKQGKPVVGFRTSTHAFLYRNQLDLAYYNDQWPVEIFGQQWITHHGHFEDGKNPLTQVSIHSGAAKSPILRGIRPFEAYSWLYHVDGGDWKLPAGCDLLLDGTSLKSQHAQAGRLEKYPLTQPVAWTKTHRHGQGVEGRVFFTTLGHPYDFRDPAMRKLAIQGMYWALGLEKEIPRRGINVTLKEPYEPRNSGIGGN